MQNKYSLLVKSVLMDAIGMSSYILPVLGEYGDIIWAPVSAYILYKMYPGTEGKIGSLINFVEESLPFIDVIPTFTLTWIYKFILQNENAKIQSQVNS